jgi:hypothetical protein
MVHPSFLFIVSQGRTIERARMTNYAWHRADDQRQARLRRGKRAAVTRQNSIGRAQTGYHGAKLPPYC